MDLLVNLYDMECKCDLKKIKENGIVIKRALSPDKTAILDFIKREYHQHWVDESEHAFASNPIACYIAVKDGEIIGFSCYDATAKGYFGPIGLKQGEKRRGVGQGLLYATLEGMKEAGYGYAIIGWVGDALPFYEKTVKLQKIADSEPEKTIYQCLIAI